ncbi:MAG: hypothetical protein HY917_01575 [Candidatus Diapherotrites archaeon]|nr:hypothetical protein [Candidatus Diapherotrites archaeon]
MVIQKGILGIEIRTVHVKPGKADDPLKEYSLESSFFLVRRPSNQAPEKFVSNPVIRNYFEPMLQSGKLELEGRFGYMNLSVIGKVAHWAWYYPFGRSRDPRYWRRLGVAQLLEFMVLRKTKELYPQVEFVVHEAISPPRARQLTRRGFSHPDLGNPIPFDTYMKLLHEKIKADIQKARIKRNSSVRKALTKMGAGARRLLHRNTPK